MIRIDTIWLALGGSDLRAGMDTLLARVVREIEGGARIHSAYVFANRGATRLKVLVYDGAGLWLCNRRLQQGRFIWPSGDGRRCCTDDHPSAVGLAHRRGTLATFERPTKHHCGLKRQRFYGPFQGAICPLIDALFQPHFSPISPLFFSPCPLEKVPISSRACARHNWPHARTCP